MKKYFPLFLASIWLVAVSIGTGVLAVHDYTPGTDTVIPGNWPTQSKIPHAPGRPTLVMFAHPNCPCTRASIGELTVLMTHCQNRVNASVVFFRPKGSDENWAHTDLWRNAEAIPGVMVRADEDGNEARNFQVTTSGHVVLYDGHGKLLFTGGITLSRGHYGDNEGLSAVMNLLNHEMATVSETQVFGCSLLDPKSIFDTKDPVCAH